ncbi:hypothetical protein N7493_012048 [Penicillium malachiteum]|uniref:Major facilitator superfamily (MFS) profile domain-containing protein n=1 Tax=Penicillium malachiteum TaxID=1324776 RepID=A0AAD6HA56_9EURO|nr:hypothetical protein N7493_012048 [Penicillium malachiteum]
MAPDLELNREDREDAPFLTPEPNSHLPASTPGPVLHNEPKPNTQGTAGNYASVQKISFRLKLILFSMILAVEIGFSFLEGPQVRIFESIACRQYYSVVDPSQIGANGQVPEEMCKGAEVQAELAAVKGALMAIPYGLLADRRGRKSTLLIGLPGFFLNSMITVAVMWFSEAIPLRAVWLSSLAWLIGGGPVVTFAIIWTMMSDVTTEDERYFHP